MTKSRKKFDAAFKAKIAVEALREDCDGSGTGEAARGASEPDLCLEEAGSRQCGEPVRRGASGSGDGEEERARDGQALRQDRPTDGRTGFLGQEARAMSAPDRAMVERPGKDLSVRRQCALVGVARSGVYRPKPVAEADDLAVMRAPWCRTI